MMKFSIITATYNIFSFISDALNSVGEQVGVTIEHLIIDGESKVETEKIVWANKPMCNWAIIRPTSIWRPWFSTPYKNFFD